MRIAAVLAFAVALVLSRGASGQGEPQPGENYVETIPGTTVTFEMIWVPEGRFWIGKTEVTWDEFEVWYFKKDLPPGADAATRPSPAYEPPDQGWGRKRRPAIKLSRHAARSYGVWLSEVTGRAYRLPTGAEWELACGPMPEDVSRFAWTAANSDSRTHEVATREPNALGIHDMLGNVCEYVEDDWSEDDPVPAIRGGAWNTPEVARETRARYDEAWNARDPQRPRSVWWVCDGSFLGFRLARSAP
ncbi:MAG: SUMF1/EgtB/PvdO family nonheme iron enzyme [Planctomycetes bacterium]|nr:SUMF1/EgtB/PvdO family nonheme iron enzyme [Planctomycetota bacterium]